MGLLQHSETWLAHAHQPVLVDDGSFFKYVSCSIIEIQQRIDSFCLANLQLVSDVLRLRET